MLTALLDGVWKELYQVVVGRFYTPATLGQYTRAKHYAKLFSQNLTSVMDRVTYPVLSSIQDDKERMFSAYRRIIRTSMFITAVALFFLGAVSEPRVQMARGINLPAFYLHQFQPLSPPCHQPEHAEGSGAERPVPRT